MQTAETPPHALQQTDAENSQKNTKESDVETEEPTSGDASSEDMQMEELQQQETQRQAAREAEVAEKEVRAKLQRFVQNQKSWANRDVNGTMNSIDMLVRQGLALTDIGVPLDPSLQTLTAVLGDQSAGKTVVVLALLQQVVLDVKEDIGTTVRTFVQQACDLGQQEDYLCDISYKDHEFTRTSLTLADLQKTYETLSQKNKKQENAKDRIDTTNVCKILIRTKEPSLGLQVMDHPGFTYELYEPVAKAFSETFRDFFTGESGKPVCKNSSVLLCHAIDKTPSEGSFRNLCEFYNKLDEGQMFLAVTKCDLLADKSHMEKIAKRMQEAKYNICEKSGKVTVTPLQILDFMEGEIKKNLPAHTEVFFVTGYKGSIQKLVESHPDPKTRFKQFKHDSRHGMQVTEDAFKRILSDDRSWRECDVMLQASTEEETQAVKDRIGMRKLIKALKRKAAEGFQDVAQKVQSEYRTRLGQVEEELAHAEQTAMHRVDIANTARLVLRTFMETYLTLVDRELYNPRAGGAMKGDNTTDLIHDIIYQAWNRQRPTAGWTLDEEYELFERLRHRGTFPPQNSVNDASLNVTLDDWKVQFHELKDYCVRN